MFPKEEQKVELLCEIDFPVLFNKYGNDDSKPSPMDWESYFMLNIKREIKDIAG